VVYQFSRFLWIVLTHEFKNPTDIFPYMYRCTDYDLRIHEIVIFLKQRKVVSANLGEFTLCDNNDEKLYVVIEF